MVISRSVAGMLLVRLLVMVVLPEPVLPTIKMRIADDEIRAYANFR